SRIVEAFFHAHYFLEMAVRYGKQLKHPPRQLEAVGRRSSTSTACGSPHHASRARRDRQRLLRGPEERRPDTRIARVSTAPPGFEPGLPDPESGVLPVTPRGSDCSPPKIVASSNLWYQPFRGINPFSETPRAGRAQHLRDPDDHHHRTGQVGEPGPSLHAAADELRGACRQEKQRDEPLHAPEDCVQHIHCITLLLCVITLRIV